MSDLPRYIGAIATPKHTQWKRASDTTLRQLLRSGNLTGSQKHNVKAQLERRGKKDPIAEFLSKFDEATQAQLRKLL